MTEPNLELLKQILAVPTFFREEHTLLRFLVQYLKTVDYTVHYTIDDYGNLYITKGVAEIYPCVCAHTDSVQPHRDIQIHEVTLKNKLRLIGKHANNNNQCGIGADDKAGVFVCMELLRIMPAIKVALFAGEEFGCIGSYNSDPEFFKNVGYVIEFDCPGGCDVTHYCNGVQLFDEQGIFYAVVKPILAEIMGKEPKLWRHPYTDVWPLKCAHPVSCINLATGYHKYHTSYEYVVVDEVFNAIEMGKRCIEALGNSVYTFAPLLNEVASYERTVSRIKAEYPDVFEDEIEPYKNILTE
jgi:tripeptide aminopeptidase